MNNNIYYNSCSCFRLFDWRPEKVIGERAKHEKVVVIKNLFDSSTFDKDVGLILEYQEDLREECKKCGDVRKVVIYDVRVNIVLHGLTLVIIFL